jgi:hypothetical protein
MHDHTQARCRHLEEFCALVAASKRLKKVFKADWFAETKGTHPQGSW